MQSHYNVLVYLWLIILQLKLVNQNTVDTFYFVSAAIWLAVAAQKQIGIIIDEQLKYYKSNHNSQEVNNSISLFSLCIR